MVSQIHRRSLGQAPNGSQGMVGPSVSWNSSAGRFFSRVARVTGSGPERAHLGLPQFPMYQTSGESGSGGQLSNFCHPSFLERRALTARPDAYTIRVIQVPSAPNEGSHDECIKRKVFL